MKYEHITLPSSGERITISGPIKLFHEAIKVISPKVPMAGLSSGTTMRQ